MPVPPSEVCTHSCALLPPIMKAETMVISTPPPVARSQLSRGIERAVLASGLSRTEFARRCSVSPSTLLLWTRDVTVPSDANLTRVARLLGCTQDDLRDGLPDLYGSGN